jgi:hypothetical protein
VHDDRVVYEWSQTVNDVDVFAPLPSGMKVTAKMLFVTLERQALEFGIVGTSPYMQVSLPSQSRTCLS